LKRWTPSSSGGEFEGFEEHPEGEWVEHHDAQRAITGALLHGKIGALGEVFFAIVAIEGKEGGSLADLRDWIGLRLEVNTKMLEVFRETGEIPTARRLAEVERVFREEDLRLERKFARMDRWIWASMGVMVALPVGAFLGKGDYAGAALGVGIARGQRWLSKRRKAKPRPWP
jgi:hypothetical protein